MALRLPELSPTAWNTLRNLFAQGFGLLLFAVQAPLLGPHAFGLITLVMIFVGFCEHVLEIATTEALTALREPDRQHYATMTTAGGAFAIVLGLSVALCAEPIAALFKEPELAEVLRWMALLPVLTAITTAPNAAARRDMNFKPLAQRTILSIGVSGVVGLTLTVLGYGVWALVWQAMLQRAINLILIWYFVPLPFELGYSRRHMAEMMPFTGPMLVTQTMSWGAGQAPRFILGLYVGTTEVGLFSLASRLNEILLQLTISPRFQVARIEMRRFTDDHTGLPDALAKVLRDMAVLSFPMAIGAAAVMPVLFSVWLDARWAGGVGAAQLMMLMCLPFVTHYALSAALLGLHQQKRVAQTSTVQSLSTVLCLLVAAPFGLIPAVAALALQPLLTAVLPVRFLRGASGVGLDTVLRSQAALLLSAVTMGVAVAGLILMVRSRVGDLATLMLAVACGIAVYAAMLQRLAPEALAPFAQALTRRLSRFRSRPLDASPMAPVPAAASLPPRPLGADLRFFALVLAGVLAVELALLWPVIAAYFPTHDDTALISASVPIGPGFDPALWFTRGFSDYFLSYPEWTPHSAEFTRPMSNAWYWLNFQLFGEHWTGQLIVGYLAHALVVALVGLACRRLLRLPMPAVLGAILFTALSPAFISRYKSIYPIPAMMQFPSYHTEIVASLLVLLAVLAFVKRRFAVFGLLVSAALLMKETMLGVPFAALLMVGIWRQPGWRVSLLNMVWLVLPLLLWSLCRSLLHSNGHELYPLITDNPLGAVGQMLRNLLLWPGALYTAGLRETLDALRQRDVLLLAEHGAALLVTALWWLILGGMLLVSGRRLLRAPLQAPPLWTVAMLFGFANLALVVLLPSTQVRYGYLWFALAPLAVFGFVAERLGSLPAGTRGAHRRSLLIASGIVFAATTAVQVGQLRQSLSDRSLAMYREVKLAAVRFVAQLDALPPGTRKVYVIDEAFSLISSPQHFARLAHFPGELIYLTGVQPTADCERQPLDRYQLSSDGLVQRLHYRRAPCLQYVQLAPLSAFDADNRILRGTTMRYRYPELRRLPDNGPRAKKGEFESGDVVDIEVRDPDCAAAGACVWLAYDEIRQDYFRLD